MLGKINLIVYTKLKWEVIQKFVLECMNEMKEQQLSQFEIGGGSLLKNF